MMSSFIIGFLVGSFLTEILMVALFSSHNEGGDDE